MTTLSIVVAEPQALIRSGVRALLERQSGWKVVAEAATGREAVKQAKLHRPDVVVLALEMPELNGTQVTHQILKILPDTRILMVTTHDEAEVIEDSVAGGVTGYILKSDTEH